MKKRIIVLIMACLMCTYLFMGCSGKSEEVQNKDSNAETKAETKTKTETETEEIPTIVIYNNSGAFNVAGAEAGSKGKT